MKSILRATYFLIALALFSIPMFAQDPGEIVVHFNNTVAVPGHLLAPGTYTFRRIDITDNGAYEIIRNDTGENIGALFVEPGAERDKAQLADLNQTLIDCSAPVNGVRMVKEWFPTGDRDGYLVVYTKHEVAKIRELAQARMKSSGSFGQP